MIPRVYLYENTEIFDTNWFHSKDYNNDGIQLWLLPMNVLAELVNRDQVDLIHLSELILYTIYSVFGLELHEKTANIGRLSTNFYEAERRLILDANIGLLSIVSLMSHSLISIERLRNWVQLDNWRQQYCKIQFQFILKEGLHVAELQQCNGVYC